MSGANQTLAGEKKTAYKNIRHSGNRRIVVGKDLQLPRKDKAFSQRHAVTEK